MSEFPQIVENDRPRTGVLFDRVPTVGVIVQGLDVDELKQQKHVTEEEVIDYQKKFGASKAFRYKPGYKDEQHWEYTEYMLLDQQNRPMSVSKNEGGIVTARTFKYDAQGRLVVRNDNLGFIEKKKEVYTYESDEPDESGSFPYSSEQSTQSGLK